MDLRKDRLARLLLAFGLWFFLTLFWLISPFRFTLLNGAGCALLALAVTFTTGFYLRLFARRLYYSLGNLSLLLSLLVLTCFAAAGVQYFFVQNFPIYLPLPIFLLCLLLGEHVALFC